MFQVDRTTTNKIESAVWSPSMDLLAIAFDSEEVSVIRTCLNWQVVWTIKEELGDVKSLVWRNDGKILSVCYDTTINLYNVEGGVLIHSSLTSDHVISWCSVNIDTNFKPLQPILPYLSPLEDVQTNIITTRNMLETTSDIHMMCLSDTERSSIKLVAQGILHIGSIKEEKVEAVAINLEGSKLCLVNHEPRYKVYNTAVLSHHKANINDVSLLYSKVLTLSEYLLSVFKAMSDTWEDVLSEFNRKLFSFHMSIHPSKLSEQFLHLLVTGNTGTELENFLVNTLKEKEIEKLLHSTMDSYKGIEKLITQNLMSCCHVMSTHLTTLLGMARWYDRYGEVGLREENVQDTIHRLAGLMIKGQELLQCIFFSKKKLGAFLKWLLKATISLSDGDNESSVKLTEDDLNHVITFLKGGSLFSTKAGTSHFNIDLVWQYFVDEDLLVPPQYYKNQILDTVLTLLKDEKPCLTVQPNASLVQSHKLFANSLLQCFDLDLGKIEQEITCLHTVEISSLYSLSNDAQYFRFVGSNNSITLVTLDADNIEISYSSRYLTSHSISNIFGYDKDFILVTRDSDNNHVLNVCFEDDSSKTNLPCDVEKIYISENRRLGAIVSASRRRIQILDLEDDCDEDVP